MILRTASAISHGRGIDSKLGHPITLERRGSASAARSASAVLPEVHTTRLIVG